MTDIVVIGSLNMDLVVKTDRMPKGGETIRGENLKTIPGGKGANQAAAVALMGNRVSMVGRVGDDAFGQTLIDNLIKLKVGTDFIKVDRGVSTGTAVIIVDKDGQNSIVVSPGANGRVNSEDIDKTEKLIQFAKLLVLQFEIPIPTVVYAMQIAHKNSVKVILNPAPALPVNADLLKEADYLVPNESELQLLSGVEVKDIESAKAAGQKLVDQGVQVLIVTMGERGALIFNRGEIQQISAYQVSAVDTTAAGDAFIGGLASALVKGCTLEESVAFGCAAGSLAVTRFGAQTSLPSLHEVESFLNARKPI